MVVSCSSGDGCGVYVVVVDVEIICKGCNYWVFLIGVVGSGDEV